MTKRGVAWHRHPKPLTPWVRADRADVVVVGLGGSGLASVHRLLDLGLDVVGVDAAPFAGAGAAGRNGGFLLAGLAAFHHHARARFGAAASSLYQLTVEAMASMAEASPGVVSPVGSLRVEDSAEGQRDLDAHAEALWADGFEASRRSDGLWIPTDGVMDPFARVQARAAAAIARGARLYGGVSVEGIDAGHVRVAQGPGLHADAVVVCVDGLLHRLFPALPGVRPVRLQMAATAATAPVADCAVYARGGLDYWQQRPDGRVFLGGARDVGGSSEDTEVQEPSAPVQAALDARLSALGVRAAVTHRWAGVVGYTPTGLPWLGEVRRGVWAAGGYCGTGNVVGWLAGRSLAHAVVGRRDSFALALAEASQRVSASVDPAP